MPSSHRSLPRRGFQWDLARQVERLDVLLALLPRYAEWGYQELYLHLEDAVHYPSLPGVARADAYSYAELQQLVDAATAVGIGVVPIVNLLGHTDYLVKVPALRDLNELRAPDGSPLEHGQLCPLHPETLPISEKLLSDMRPFCTTGKVHVGLDESFHLGKCPRCRPEVEARGLPYHFSAYVHRLHALTTRQGLRLGLWADMLYFIPEAIPQLPRGIVAYDWYYYPFKRHPRVELYNFAERDLCSALQSQDIEYWGCPMNGAFRYEPLPVYRDRLGNIRSWWQRCLQRKAGGMLVTSWEAYRLALESTTVVDAAASALWQEPWTEPTDLALLTRGFQLYTGARRVLAQSCAQTALASDAYPFSGYARWEINDRWDVTDAFATAEDGEVAHFEALQRRSAQYPPFLRHSLDFRLYLARRDAFLRSLAAGILELRARAANGGTVAFELRFGELLARTRAFADHLAEGLRAAEALWLLTRSEQQEGQNIRILRKDFERLGELIDWLQRAARDDHSIHTASPVCGEWQFRMEVHNVAPALQRVSVESQEPDGTWKELHARYTIEFLARAARPRADIVRVFSCPVPRGDLALRLVLRGVGEVEVKNLSLSNGVSTVRLLPEANRRRLGRPAPTSGFPDIRQVQEVRTLRRKHVPSEATSS